MVHKIRYQEFKPLKRAIIFDTRAEYVKFFDDYFRKILDDCWSKGVSYREIYDYRVDNLNKDGSLRKKVEKPSWLWTKKAKANQKKGWLEYVEKRKKLTKQKNLVKKIAELENLIENKRKELLELK